MLASLNRYRKKTSKIRTGESMNGEPRAFLILDMDSGNAVASYDTFDQAERALRRALKTRTAEEIEDLVLVTYDKDGNQLSRTLATSLNGPSPVEA
jgi:hypothetical protein